MAATSAMYRPSSTVYHSYQPSYTSPRHTTDKLSLIIRLPGEEVVRIRNIKDGSSIRHVKNKVELLSGFAPSTYKMYNVQEMPIVDSGTLRIGDNICDNEVVKLRLHYPYDRLYEMLETGSGSVSEHLNVQEDLSQEQAFNIMFMCCYHGHVDFIRALLSNHDISASATTPNGNTCLHAAVAKDQVDTALELCKYGADIYQKNKHGDTPLDVALEFGSFTCERRLRLSQWARRRAKMTRETTYTQSFDGQSTEHKTDGTARQSSGMLSNESADGSTDIPQNPTTKLDTTHDADYINDDRLIRPSTASHLHQRPTTQGSTRSRMSTVNHPMPKASVNKKRERASRVRSAPPLNSEVRNRRLCKVESNERPPVTVATQSEDQKQRFTVTKPQYLQYIKSSTGIVEEDYFADIFPDQADEPKETRSFDDQMKRNERIFKRMFKESGVVQEGSDTDSGEELARELANRKAVKRWNKKQQIKKQEEGKKLAICPYSTDKARREGLGELLLIGDTSRGQTTDSEPERYIRAYQAYKEQARHDSTRPSSNTVRFMDPVTYEQWVSTKPHRTGNNNNVEKPASSKSHLVKRIDYNTWLDAATKRINKQHTLQKKEEKQKKDFEEWIQELKDEVGTFDYWRRRKEEQMAKERQLKLKKQEEEKRKQAENDKRKQLAKDIYKHWATSKEMSKLKQEENKLSKEKARLQQAKTTK